MKSSYFNNITASSNQNEGFNFKIPKLPPGTRRNKVTTINEHQLADDASNVDTLSQLRNELFDLWEVQIRLGLPLEDLYACLQNYKTEVNSKCMSQITKQLNIGHKYAPTEGSVWSNTFSRNTQPSSQFHFPLNQDKRTMFQYSQQINTNVQNASRMTGICSTYERERTGLAIPSTSSQVKRSQVKSRKRVSPKSNVVEEKTDDSLVSCFREDTLKKTKVSTTKMNTTAARRQKYVPKQNTRTKETKRLAETNRRKRFSISLQTSTLTVTRSSLRNSIDSGVVTVKSKRQSKTPFRNSFVYSLPYKRNNTLRNTEATRAARTKIAQYCADGNSNTQSSSGFSATSTPLITSSRTTRNVRRKPLIVPKKKIVPYEEMSVNECSDFSDLDE